MRRRQIRKLNDHREKKKRERILVKMKGKRIRWHLTRDGLRHSTEHCNKCVSIEYRSSTCNERSTRNPLCELDWDRYELALHSSRSRRSASFEYVRGSFGYSADRWCTSVSSYCCYSYRWRISRTTVDVDREERFRWDGIVNAWCERFDRADRWSEREIPRSAADWRSCQTKRRRKRFDHEHIDRYNQTIDYNLRRLSRDWSGDWSNSEWSDSSIASAVRSGNARANQQVDRSLIPDDYRRDGDTSNKSQRERQNQGLTSRKANRTFRNSWENNVWSLFVSELCERRSVDREHRNTSWIHSSIRRDSVRDNRNWFPIDDQLRSE